MAQNRSGLIGAVAAGGVVLLLAGSAVWEWWVFRGDEAPTLQPETGAMVLTVTPTVVEVAAAATVAETPTVEESLAAIGSVATLAEKSRFYSDVNIESMALGEGQAGDQVVLIEPSGDYYDYPVLKEGVEWVRVRANDGLVGWVMLDKLLFEQR